MSKISNCLLMINILLDGKLHPAREFAEKLGMKISSIRWYMDELLVGGLEIESKRGPGGGYRLNKRMSSNRICNLIKECGRIE